MRYWMVLLASALLFLSGCPSLSKEDKEEIKKIVDESNQQHTKPLATRQDVKDGFVEADRKDDERFTAAHGWHTKQLAQIEEGVDSTELQAALKESDEALLARLNTRLDVVEELLEPVATPEEVAAEVLRQQREAAEAAEVLEEDERQDDDVGASSSEALEQLRDGLNGRLLTEQTRASEVVEFFESLALIEYDEVDEIIEQLRRLEFEEVNSRGRTVVRVGVIEGRDTNVLLTIRRRLKPFANRSGQAFSDAFKEGVAIYFGTLADGEDRRVAEATVMAWLRSLSGGDKGAILLKSPQASVQPPQVPAGTYKPTRPYNSYPASPYSRYYYPRGYGVAPR